MHLDAVVEHLDEVDALVVQLARGVFAQPHVKAAKQLRPLHQRNSNVSRALGIYPHQVLRTQGRKAGVACPHHHMAPAGGCRYNI